MALIFVAGVAGHMALGGTGAKWFIFMTDLGVLFLTIHYVMDAILAICRWTWEHFNKEDECKRKC